MSGFEWFFDLPGVVIVGFVAWVAIKLSRALRARDVDYSRAMAADMAERERQAAAQREQGSPTVRPVRFERRPSRE